MNPTQIVSRFYDARDGMRAIAGDNYEARIKQPKEIMRAVMAKHQCKTLKAFLILNQENSLDGWEQVVLMAAVCEIDEDEARAEMDRTTRPKNCQPTVN